MKEEKSALKHLFNADCEQRSPVKDDFNRKVKFDEDGNEFIVFEKVDYPTFQKSLGSVRDWQLDALLAAGINPNFPVHTGNNTRLEGLNSIEQFEAAADALLADIENEHNNN